jgi:hypothetical protein
VHASLGHTGSSPSDRARVPLDPDDLPRRTHQLGCQHGNVTDAGTDIEDSLAFADACLTE